MIQSRIFKQKNNTADGDDNPFMNLIWHFYEGLSCLTSSHHDWNDCHGSFFTIILFVVSNAIILVSIDRLISINSGILNRASMITICVTSLILMSDAELRTSLNGDRNMEENPLWLNVVIIIVVLIGMELYGNTGDRIQIDRLHVNDHNTTNAAMKV